MIDAQMISNMLHIGGFKKVNSDKSGNYVFINKNNMILKFSINNGINYGPRFRKRVPVVMIERSGGYASNQRSNKWTLTTEIIDFDNLPEPNDDYRDLTVVDWQQIPEVAKLKVNNKVIEYLKNGKFKFLRLDNSSSYLDKILLINEFGKLHIIQGRGGFTSDIPGIKYRYTDVWGLMKEGVFPLYGVR